MTIDLSRLKEFFSYLQMKKSCYLFTLSSMFLLLTLMAGCKKEDAAKLPTVSTLAVTGVNNDSAVSGGNITSDGGAEITAKGVCWGVTPLPTIDSSKVSGGINTTSFTSNIAGLKESKVYYIRAYAVNRKGVGYGQVISFTTIGHPSVVIGGGTNITPTSFNVSGKVQFDGGSAVTTRGFCWSTKSLPTTADDKVEAGISTDTFTGVITGLKQGTVYYVRAYAVNAAGTAYSNQSIISTSAIDSDGNIYHTIVIGTQLWMVENLKTTHYRNGDAIPLVQNNTTWENTLTGAYCDYNNDISIGNVYGHLYKYETIKDLRNVCPEGWRLPTNVDWLALENYLGGSGVAGGKMKEAGTTHWIAPNTGATNSSGFTALPAGNRGFGGFASIGKYCYFWSDPSDINTRALMYDLNSTAGTGNGHSVLGLSIRCIKE